MIDPAPIIETNPVWRGRGVRVSSLIPPVASPMQRGVDHDCWLVEIEEDRWFLKIPSSDHHRFIDSQAALAAAEAAGIQGVAPPLLWSDGTIGAGAWPLLGPGWRNATLADLSTPSVLAALLDTKRRLHRGPALARTRSVFDLVRRYTEMASSLGVAIPEDHGWMVNYLGEMELAISASGIDLAACHGDGIASNVMLGPGNAVLLVDWDEATNADPYWDLGSVFAEAFAFDPPARTALEMYDGRCNEALLARCRLYGIADDVAWGTRSLIASATTERLDLEFFKYAQWRFLRARMSLHDRRFEEWLRIV